jgi:hypothetical protein
MSVVIGTSWIRVALTLFKPIADTCPSADTRLPACGGLTTTAQRLTRPGTGTSTISRSGASHSSPASQPCRQADVEVDGGADAGQGDGAGVVEDAALGWPGMAQRRTLALARVWTWVRAFNPPAWG